MSEPIPILKSIPMSKFEYRAARRRESDARMHAANDKAKLGQRQGQCAAARDTLMVFLANNRFAGRPQIKAALAAFWSDQLRTRPVSRILKELEWTGRIKPYVVHIGDQIQGELRA